MMQFISKGSEGLEIRYTENDTDTEKRIIEQGVALLRNLLVRFNQVKGVTDEQ